MHFSLLQNVKILEENGAVRQLGSLMKEAGYRHAFLVCDEGIVRMGLAGKIQDIIAAEGLSCTLYDKVQPDPPAFLVDEGAALCRSAGCDCVIAAGGGSSIDTAKGINILRFNEGHILDYADPARKMTPAHGLIVIPTTSGTGSELSNGLIISDTERGIKAPILAVEGMSEYAILDPELTAGMPPMLTLITGLDVFSHACESYMSINATTTTDMICEKIMEDVAAFLPRAVRQGSDKEARGRMLCCASLGGWRLACACAHVGHSIAHIIGATYHIPHGRACAFSLPPTLEFMASTCPEKVKKVGMLLGAAFYGSESPEQIGQRTARAYRDFCAGLGLTELGVKKPGDAELDALADAVAHEPLATLCPVPVTKENMRPLLEKMF